MEVSFPFPMPLEEIAFLDGLREHPGDETLRLIVADWLDEQGEYERAEFIRNEFRVLGVKVDDETVTASVRRTGRAIVVHEASRFCGYGAEVAARLSEQCFHYLEAPVRRVTGFDIPYPPPHLEEFHLPSVDRILDAVDSLQWQETHPTVKASS